MPSMFDDPDPMDEQDPAVKEELFDLYSSLGLSPEDLKTASEEEL